MDDTQDLYTLEHGQQTVDQQAQMWLDFFQGRLGIDVVNGQPLTFDGTEKTRANPDDIHYALPGYDPAHHIQVDVADPMTAWASYLTTHEDGRWSWNQRDVFTLMLFAKSRGADDSIDNATLQGRVIGADEALIAFLKVAKGTDNAADMLTLLPDDAVPGGADVFWAPVTAGLAYALTNRSPAVVEAVLAFLAHGALPLSWTPVLNDAIKQLYGLITTRVYNDPAVVRTISTAITNVQGKLANMAAQAAQAALAKKIDVMTKGGGKAPVPTADRTTDWNDYLTSSNFVLAGLAGLAGLVWFRSKYR